MGKKRKRQSAKAEQSERFWDAMEVAGEEALSKARSGDIDPLINDSRGAGTKGPKSLFVNPYEFYGTSQGLWKERPSQITWETLRFIANKNPIISGIINTRINQVASFSSPVRLMEMSGNAPLGYKVVPLTGEKKLTKQQQAKAQEIEQMLWGCGIEDPRTFYDRDNFDNWIRKVVRDSLTFDGTATEIVPTRNGKGVFEWTAVDTATIRIAQVKQDIDTDDELAFVQLLQGRIVTQFNQAEMMYGIRYPNTDLRLNSYGTSEIEMLISVVTSVMNAMTHNSMFFKNGAAVKGILNIKNKGGSDVGNTQLEAFKRAWYAMITGTANAWKTPIIQSEGAEFINMGNTNREMEFIKYLDFLVKITCAVFQIDPAEINFYMSGNSGGSSMFEGSQEQKLKNSKDKGLRPLLNAISRWINQFIMPRLAPGWYFTFSGIDQKDEKDIIDLRTKEVGSYKMIDEIREEVGLKPLGEEKGGDLILNPQYVMAMNQRQMQEMQAQGMQGGAGDDGDFGDIGGDEGGEDQGQDQGGKGQEPEDEDYDEEDLENFRPDKDARKEMQKSLAQLAKSVGAAPANVLEEAKKYVIFHIEDD